MTTAAQPAYAARAERCVPPMGGLNPTLLRIELLRVLRNRRTMIFTLIMPAVFYLIFGVGQSYATQSAGHGNVAAYIMISMAAYGAMIASTGGGAMVATERAQGWSRQLRLTPLSPMVYVVVKLLTAMVLGALAVVVVFVIGAFTKAQMDTVGIWVATGLIAWAGSIVFAAFGLFMGYLLPSENVMQIIGPGLAILAFAGGLFVPLEDGSTLQKIAQFTPMYGISSLAHAPLTGDPFKWTWVLNVLVWLAIFAGGAIWRFRKDTARV
ncbi:MAG TPA: ABC transporter permease [Nocardioidaceae bacterium]|nr:ABC transporter permease [Nocardioidaceae bacterium]